MLTMVKEPERKEGRLCAKNRNVKYLHELLDRVFINGSDGVGSLIMAFHGQDGRSGRQPWYMLSLAKKDWRALHRFETGLCMKKDLFVKYADLSRFPLLHSLQIYDPELKESISWSWFIDHDKNEKLCLNYDLEKKNPVVIEKLCNESLVHTPDLHTLNLSNSYLMKYPSDVRLLLEHGLTRIRNLHTLKLRYTSLDNKGLAQLSEVGLAHVPNLRTLDLANNYIGDDGLKVLSEVGLAHVPHLHTLNIGDNYIRSAGLRVLSVVGFAHVPTLHTLNLSDNSLKEKDLFVFFHSGEVLSEVGLHTLDLSRNDFFSYDSFVGGLRRFSKLRTLILTLNHASIKDLAEFGLAHVPNLSTLALDYSGIDKDDGLKVLSEVGLAHVPNLRTLDLSNNNRIGDDGFKVLSEVGLAHVPLLHNLYIGGNIDDIPSDIGVGYYGMSYWYNNERRYNKGLRYLFNGLRRVPELRTLGLCHNSIGFKDVKVLAEIGLAHVPNLRTLDLSDNFINGAGLQVLSEVGLAHVPHLHTLDLSKNSEILEDIGMNSKIKAKLELAFNLHDLPVPRLLL